jgi:hypothetical protein
MANAVEHNLGDRATAALILVVGFIIYGTSKAVEGLGVGSGTTLEVE